MAIGAALLAIVLVWMLGPPSSPPIEAPPPPPVRVDKPVPYALRNAPSPAPRRPEAPEAPPAEPERPIAQPIALVPTIAPRPPFDPDRVYEVDAGGISSALFDRQPRIVSCYRDHVDAHGPVRGRPTIRATVLPDEGDGPRSEIMVENDGEGLADLDSCLQRALDDANFGDVDIPTTVLYPIPLPSQF